MYVYGEGQLRRWMARWHEGVQFEWSSDWEGCMARSSQADAAAGRRVAVTGLPVAAASFVHTVTGELAEVLWEAGGFAGRRRIPGEGDVWCRPSVRSALAGQLGACEWPDG
jgi:hypothetical protein